MKGTVSREKAFNMGEKIWLLKKPQIHLKFLNSHSTAICIGACELSIDMKYHSHICIRA